MKRLGLAAICILAAAAVLAQEPPVHPRAAGSHRYRVEGCAQCHTSGLATRRAGAVLPTAYPRSFEWHLAHLHDPRSVSPGSTMPAYRHLYWPNAAAARVRTFIETYDSRDGSMDQDGIVTQREYERAGGANWESELRQLDSGNGVVSMADGAPRASFELKALVEHLLQLQPEHYVAEGGTPTPAAKPSIERGERLYLRHCAGCHGTRADGNGPAAPFFGDFPPRNFLRGEYRYRSTLAPEPPTDADLFRTIRRGAGPSMPPWPHLSDGQVWDLVEFLKSNHPGYLHQALVIESGRTMLAFTPALPDLVDDPDGVDLEGGRVQKRGGKWLWISGGEEKVVTDGMRAGRYRFRLGDTVMDWMDGFGPRPLHLGSEPFAYTRESAEIGAAVYAEMGCASCHGKEGRGDGSSADESRGSLGQRVLPNDYTKGNFKGGADAASLVQSFLTGLHGTPMPSFHESFRGVRSAAPDTAPWHLAHFIQRQAGVPYPGDE